MISPFCNKESRKEANIRTGAKDGILRKLGNVKIIPSKYKKIIASNDEDFDCLIEGNAENVSFFYVNLGEYGAKINAYSLKNSNIKKGVLINPTLSASNDGVQWVELKVHPNDDSLQKVGSFETAQWKINNNDQSNAFFSYFKVEMSGCNDLGKWEFGCCGFEIFGEYTKDFDCSYHNEMWIKTGIPKTFKFEGNEALEINKQLNVNHHLNVYSKSSIIITKDGEINLNGRGITHYKYESDFDKNGILYAIGTHFGRTNYQNPSKKGYIELESSPMDCGNNSYFVHREKVGACTKSVDNAFFSINFKQYAIKPNAYTLRCDIYGFSHLKSWNLEASNDGKYWTLLKVHQNDKSLDGKYKSKTWKLQNVNDFYSYFRVIMTGKNGYYNWELHCSGMEIYGDLKVPSRLSVYSDSSITNFGKITSQNSINIKCTKFENFGSVKASKDAKIAIKCNEYKNESLIDPKPQIIKY